MAKLAAALGVIAFAIGGLLEVVAVIAMASFKFRRRLPLQSPIQLIGWASWLILGGFALIGLSIYLKRI